MIYISSAYSKQEKIGDVVRELAQLGFKWIELTGGTKYYDRYEEELLILKEEYDLSYLIHNYFPPPQEAFVLNLASLNDKIYQKSLDHYRRAIDLSKRLGAKQFSLHAGYFIDIDIKEIGGKVGLYELSDRDKAIKRFCEGFNLLKENAADVELYIENNVLSHINALRYQHVRPFMLLDYNDYLELKYLIDFDLLLDVAHSRVSSYSLNLDFHNELDRMMAVSDYIHLSNNDGKSDQNKYFSQKDELLNKMSKYKLKNKIITIEVYDKIGKIIDTYQLVGKFINLPAQN